jgi:hypothetical protein
MRWMFFLNGLGALLSVAYAGFVASRGWAPWWAGGAVLAFMAAVFTPFLSEFGAMGQGFSRLEGDFLDSVRRPFFPKHDVEVFSGQDPPDVWQKKREPVKMIVFLTLVGIVLLGIDATGYVVNAPSQEENRIITNF